MAATDIEKTQIATAQYEAYLKAKKTLVLKSFWEFCVEVLEYKNLEPFHLELCNFIQDNKTSKRLVLLPRGHLKSTIVTVAYALWRLAQDPSLRILIANATAPMAEAFLRQVKNHMQYNKKFIELFGDYAKSAEKWSDGAIRLSQIRSFESKENSIIAFGIGGSLVSQHYDIMIFDDLVNRENIHTPDRIQDVLTFYKDAQDLVDDPLRTEQVMIGTRWHEGDLYGTLTDKDNPERAEWKILKREAVEGEYQIVKDTSGRFVIEGGEILYPFKYPREALNKLLGAKGLSEFSAQYLNDPVPAGNAIFKHDWKYYEPTDLRGWEFNTFITIDPAFYDPSLKQREPDYTGITVIGVPYTNDWYIKDLIMDRFEPSELIDLIFDLERQYHPITIGIESTAMQRIIGYTLREEMRTRNQFLNITELVHSGSNAKSKVERIQALEPRYAVGAIYHQKNIRHMSTLEMQLRRFPRSKYDDLADALASQIEIAYPPRKQATKSQDMSRVLEYPA